VSSRDGEAPNALVVGASQDAESADGSESTPERAEIAAEIDRARARVAASLTTLGEKVTRRSDWRAWVRERPTLVVAGALALGFLCGADPPSSQD
jgi:hypothetical protein